MTTDAVSRQPSVTARRLLLALLLAVAAVRLCTLGVPALMDTTEGRYGAAALRMLTSGEWLMPQIPLEHGYEPYFGKPPLHCWMMALSMWCFGANEWAARLPGCLCAAAMVAAIVAFARRRFGDVVGLGSGLVLASMGLFFLLAGSVNVDMTLAAAVTGAVIASCRAAEPSSRRWWGHVFFACLGLGCLDKGPIAVALAGLAGIAHLAVYRDRRVVTRLPWVTGPLLFLAITVPWFWLAERQHPGFLRYFFVNENLGRFTTHDYGDRYGAGRARALGSIWLWLLLCALPWSAVPVVALCRRGWRARARAALGRDGAFLLLWGLSPAALFTLSPQFTPDYLLPGFPALAIAVALLLRGPTGAPPAVALPRAIGRIGVGFGVVGALVGWTSLQAGSGPGLVALLLALASAAVLWPRLRAPEPQLAVGLAGAAFAFGLAAAVVASAPFAGVSRSTAPILARCLAARGPAPAAIGIASRFAFSAWFYVEAWSDGRLRLKPVDVAHLADGPDDVLLRRSGLRLLPEPARQHFEVAAEVGDWAWLRRRR